jgi:type II secretory pathway component GspD/PulD (secretin)
MMGGGMGGLLAEDLRILIQDATGWENWADVSESGEGGTITAYPSQQPKKLAVLATHQVHEEIQKLLTALRKSLGHQVSIEARYLVVTENFLEEIGLDLDFSYNLGGKWGQLGFSQDSAIAAQAEATQVPLSLGGIGAASTITGGYGSILDDLQVSFLIKATQAHRDSKALTAPIVTVLSGESANFNITRYIPIALPPVQDSGTTTVSATGGGATTNTGGGITPQYTQVPSGSTLSITPVITHDKKNVLLQIITTQNDFLGIRTTVVEAPVVAGTQGGEVLTYNVQLPETESSTVMTRVSVPDRGTLLLGGQKISAEVETEAGVPILSKIPVLGRLFSNRSTVKDQKILLILVRPIIILQDEREAEALAALENQ